MEWVQDMYLPDAYQRHAKDNPVIEGNGTRRVLRGGCWSFGPVDVKCCFRTYAEANATKGALGFRVARDP